MLVVLGLAYARRAATLRARGHPVPMMRVACFAAGMLVLGAAVVSPVHELGEEYLSFHMLQHVLLGDLALLLVLAGLTGPLPRWHPDCLVRRRHSPTGPYARAPIPPSRAECPIH